MRKTSRKPGLGYVVEHGSYGTFRSAAVAVVLGIAAAVAVALWTVAPLAAKGTGGRATEHATLMAPDEGSDEQVLQAYEDLPLTFVENRGQTDGRVRYHAQGPGYAFYFTPEEVVLSLAEGASDALSPQGVALALRFVGANPDAVVAGEDRAPGKTNYLRGDDPERWQTELPGYTSVVYRELWPGIDMVLRGQDGRLKYEFHVRPGAQTSDIRLAYAGADGLALDESGGLLIGTPLGELRDSPPVSYQEIDGERVPVESRYVLDEDGGGATEYGFAVGAYDPDQELIIDPGVDYSTFLGGSSHDRAESIAVDANGNAYVAGMTQSTDFPTTVGAFDRSFAGGVMDVFVTKLSADGSGLVYSTYLGGTPTPLPAGGFSDGSEFGRGIAVDTNGNAYVAGMTTSSDFPTTAGAFDTTMGIGQNSATDAFVTKLTADGSGLVYSTFLGGTDFDDGQDIALDGSGNAYVVGDTGSTDFPTTQGAVQTTPGGGRDAFVTKLNATGSNVVYSSYLGGADNEIGNRVRVDGDGNAYVAGGTRSADFPATAGAFDTTKNGTGFDAFVTRLNATGTELAYSTFLGGSNVDRADGLAVDADGNAYVSGGTTSTDFPTTAGAFDTSLGGGSDGYVAKLDATGSALAYSTLLGGSAGEGAPGIALDADGAWVTGGTSSANFPTTADAFDAQHNGNTDVYVAKLDGTGSSLVYGTFLGGAEGENGFDVAVDSAGAAYIAGQTFSAGFPTTAGAFDTVFDGDPSIFWGDAFVTKFGSGGTTEPAPPPAERTTSTFSGEIDKNQTLGHTVSVGAAGPVDLTLDWSESRANLTLRVLDPSGSVVFSAGGNAKPKTGTFQAAGAGDYRFQITNTTDRRTSYTLSVTYPVASSSTDPEPASLSSLSLDPTSVTGGESSTGTVTLTSAAPAGGASVALSSSNTAAATVPASVTVPEGSTSATFTVSTSSVSSDTSSTISAVYNGVTRTATLAVNAPASSTDSVSISKAEYDSGKRQLRVEASSSNSSATLRVYVTATDELIGTLSGGKGEFSWPTNPENITVKSSLGGSATRTVSLK